MVKDKPKAAGEADGSVFLDFLAMLVAGGLGGALAFLGVVWLYLPADRMGTIGGVCCCACLGALAGFVPGLFFLWMTGLRWITWLLAMIIGGSLSAYLTFLLGSA
jgi:hypothetical protein